MWICLDLNMSKWLQNTFGSKVAELSVGRKLINGLLGDEAILVLSAMESSAIKVLGKKDGQLIIQQVYKLAVKVHQLSESQVITEVMRLLYLPKHISAAVLSRRLCCYL